MEKLCSYLPLLANHYATAALRGVLLVRELGFAPFSSSLLVSVVFHMHASPEHIEHLIGVVCCASFFKRYFQKFHGSMLPTLLLTFSTLCSSTPPTHIHSLANYRSHNGASMQLGSETVYSDVLPPLLPSVAKEVGNDPNTNGPNV